MAKVTRGCVSVELDIKDMYDYLYNDYEIDSNYMIDKLKECLDLDLPSNSELDLMLDVDTIKIVFPVQED